MTNSPLQPRALRYSYRRLRMLRPYTARRLLIDVPPPSKPISDVPDPPCEEPPIPLHADLIHPTASSASVNHNV
jgi:hypothetical protein